ncbi:eukaryotic translation initiation factor 2C, 2 [Dissophora globulifera]|nr:eukaryotic translation initiation factor 2C, 2 [Dissophora globulifera]
MPSRSYHLPTPACLWEQQPPRAPAAAPNQVTENTLRPDRGGSAGRATSVLANFFAIQRLPSSKIFHYDVSITPEIPPVRARQLWSFLESSPDFARERTKVAFDGRANAFAASELQLVQAAGGAIGVQIELPDGSGRSASSDRPDAKKNMFTIKIVKVSEIDIQELQRFLDKTGPFTPSCETAIHALNVVLTHKPFSSMANVGRSVYVPENATNLGGGIEKWEGIFQSIRPGPQRCYLNVDITATAFIKSGNAVEVLRSMDQRFDPSRSMHRSDVARLEQLLKGCMFTVSNRSDRPRRHKVISVSATAADRTYFDMTTNDGATRKVSVSEYFEQTYGKRLRYPALPCIGSKGKQAVCYFPIEVCSIVPGQHYKKKLNEDQLATMIKSTAVRPDVRASKIKSALRTLDFDNNPYLDSFGMRISNTMTQVRARVLSSPAIEFDNHAQEKPQQGAWQIHRARKFKRGARLDSWSVLVYDRENRDLVQMVTTFVRMLFGVMCDAGMNVTMSSPHIQYAQLGGRMEQEVDEARQRSRGLQLLVVLFPRKGTIYPQLKAYCETRNSGLVTQCALLSKLRRVNDQYCRLLSCKINTKLGGVVSTLAPNEMPFMDRGSTLVVGADVTHPSPGEDSSKPSVAAVVASVDNEAYKYIGRVLVQDPRLEVIESMQSVMAEIITSYKKVTGHHPKRILVYRDGVSESQFAEILRTEVTAIARACTQLDARYRPPITFIVVKKRHHARFFPQDNRDRDRSGNCLSGTVIDTDIIHPTEFNFYLQSHAGLQGTSKSTLYHVLTDENKFSSDTLQQLTYNLCHVYSRCPKATAMVPAVKYADMLAYRARYYLDYGVMDGKGGSSGAVQYGPIKISDDLMNKMFFV